MSIKPVITFDDFEKIDLRAGTIVSAELNPKANKPAYILKIDFGEKIGHRTSSAQITDQYTAEELVGQQIIAVMNFEPKRIAGIKSEVLVTGCPSDNGVILLQPNKKISNGVYVY